MSTAQARLEKAADRVAKNGEMISLTITPEYHRLRSLELELAARHLTAVQAEKEAERAHREELRDAKRAEEELQREREKLDKEREHYVNALDRIRELSDASVPFNFDVHALFFSKDAYGVEAMLHRTFADQRVNRINLRREFFQATPAQVLEVLRQQKVAIVEYRTDAAADEYRASQEIAASRSGKGESRSSLPNVPLQT